MIDPKQNSAGESALAQATRRKIRWIEYIRGLRMLREIRNTYEVNGQDYAVSWDASAGHDRSVYTVVGTCTGRMNHFQA